MSIYVAKVVTATAVRGADTDYVCEHCGHRDTAHVIAIGTAASEAPFGLGAGQARADAVSGAKAQLVPDRSMAVGVVGCRQCGKRSTTQSKKLWWSAFRHAARTYAG